MAQNSISEYKSVIKRWRKPILPPLMTEERKAEMLEYRRLAEETELRMKSRHEEREYLKSKIRDLFEKFRSMQSCSANLIECGQDPESNYLNRQSEFKDSNCLNGFVQIQNLNSESNNSEKCDPLVSEADLGPPLSVEFGVTMPATKLNTTCQNLVLSESDSSEFDFNESGTAILDRSSNVHGLDNSSEPQLPSHDIIATSNSFVLHPSDIAHITNKNKHREPTDIPVIYISDSHSDEESVFPISNESENPTKNELYSGKNALLCEGSYCNEDNESEAQNTSKETNNDADLSPSSRATADDSETSFHTVTPSTDLEKYMNSSADTLMSPTAPESPNCSSLVTEFSSKSEDVTVINLSSGATTPVFIEENFTGNLERDTNCVLKDLLNVSKTDDDGSVCSKKPIRRRSYTLESPSPVLLRALERNGSIGPTTKTSGKETQTLDLDISQHSKESPAAFSVIENFPRSKEISRLVARSVGKSSYRRVRRSVSESLPSNPSKMSDGLNGCREGGLKMGILQYSEQQIETLQAKYKELRSYLDRMSETLMQPSRSIKYGVTEQVENLESLRHRLLNEHYRQMAALFEQQQSQWKKLAALVRSQNSDAAGSLELPDVENEFLKDPTLQISTASLPSHLTKDQSQDPFEIAPFLQIEALDPATKPKFDRVSAAAKGFLTRKLMQSDKVLAIVQTIKDTVECALQLHSEFPRRGVFISDQDALLHQRLIVQLDAACHEFHDVFFSLSIKEKMSLIAQTRNANIEKSRKVQAAQSSPGSQISSATLKVLARKNRASSACKINSPKTLSPMPIFRSQSCPPNRHSPQSPSSWKAKNYGHNRTVNRKVKKMALKPFRP